MSKSLQIAVLGNANSWYVADLNRAADSRGHQLNRIDFTTLVGSVSSTAAAVQTPELSLSDVDAVVVRTMPPGSLERVVYRMDVLHQLEEQGKVVLNPIKSIECAVDKYLATSRLAAAGLPVPETIVCEGAEAAQAAFEKLGGDVLVKPIFGAEGRGIVRVSQPDLALRTFRTLERIQSVLYLQRFIENEGFDVRVLLLGDRILGSIKRHATDDFRTNISCNGQATVHELTDQEVDLARRAAAAVGTPFAGVDLLYGRDGSCYVIEVNAVPGWRAFAKCMGIDVASEVIEHLELACQ